MASEDRPEVRVVDPRAPAGERPDEIVSGRPHRHGRRRAAVAVLVLLAAVAVAVRQSGRAPRLSVEPARLLPGGTLAVTLVNRGRPVRVTRVSLRATGLVAGSAGALEDEVSVAEGRGVPPAHDADRALAPGRHTFLLDVRAVCPAGPPPTGQVLLDVDAGGDRQRVAGVLPAAVRERLRCEPLAVHAGVSPVPGADGTVALLLTAYAGDPPAGGTFEHLDWPGYRLSGLGGVVPLALGWAAPDSTVVFNAVVTPDCGSAPGAGLTAVFSDRVLPVPLTAAAATRVRALRSTCG